MTGSNNPLGIDVKSDKDTLPFHPYYTMKDTFGTIVFFLFFAFFVFFMPNAMGHPDNYIPADPLVTPAYIVPEWYFLAFYAIALLFILPFLDRHPVRSARFRPWYRVALLVLWADLFFLTYLGGQPAEGIYVFMAQIGVIYYYSFFLVIIPALNKYEKALPLPNSIHEAVLAKKEGK